MLRYLESFFRNKWIISVPALLLLLAGASLVVALPPEHTATATIWAESAAYLDLPLAENRYLSPAEVQARRFGELVQTFTFSRAVVDRLPASATASEEEKDNLVDQIHTGMLILTAGDHSIRVSFAHVDQQVAVGVVQLAIDEYNRVTMATANLQAAEAIAFYKERVKSYETTILPRSNKAISEYLVDHPELQNMRQPESSDPSFAVILQQAELDRAQYERYQERLDEVMTQSEAVNKNQAVAFRIVDPPQTPLGSGRLSKKLVMLFAGVGAGLSIGYVALFLGMATELDRTMRNPGDVRRRLDLHVLEVVPDYSVVTDADTFKGGTDRRAPRLAQPVQPQSGV